MLNSHTLRLERYEELVSYRQQLIESPPAATGKNQTVWAVLADLEGMRLQPATSE